LYAVRDNVKYRLDLLKNGKRAAVTAAIIIAAAIVVFVAIFNRGYSSAAKKYEGMMRELEDEFENRSDPAVVYKEVSKEVDIRLINAKIQDIGELATVEYLYTDAGKFEEPARMFGRDIPFSFTTKSFIVKWDGSIKAGVDISKVTAEVNEETKEIVVRMPKAGILSHEIKEESIETLDEKNGLFNKIKIEDIRGFDVISKGAMEQRAVENGILDKAFVNAEGIISRLVDTGAVEELGYTITFEVIEE